VVARKHDDGPVFRLHRHQMNHRQRQSRKMVGDDNGGVQVVLRCKEPAQPGGVEVRRWRCEGTVWGVQAESARRPITISGEDGKDTAWTTCRVNERRSKNSCPLHSSAGQMYKPARARGRWALALPP
jgi:hypothetical protein